MTEITRRDFVKWAGGAVVATGVAGGLSPRLVQAAKARVVVIGGGYGGAVAAKYIRMADANIEVTLVEKDKEYYSCPLSNWVVAGFRDMKYQKWTYEKLAKNHKINVIHERATAVDPAAKKVTLASGKVLDYDKLVVSPGVDFNYAAIEGYSEEASHIMTHAWNAGPQTLKLRDQLAAMPDGGLFVLVAPPDPYRCPPGPYERASLVAHYFKKNKPKSKVLILDPKEKFSKKPLFEEGWTQLYGYGTDASIIKYVAAGEGGKVTKVDTSTMTVFTEMEEFKAAVVNVIPPQKAGHIAHLAGLTNDKGWCPIHFNTFESTLHPNVYVIGDSCVAPAMPKSGYAANSQAKIAAAAIVASLNGKTPGEPTYVNTCYSMLSPDYGISVANVYKFNGKDKIEPVKGGTSPTGASPEVRKQEALYNESWYQSIMADTFS